jgi:hypothetical protein
MRGQYSRVPIRLSGLHYCMNAQVLFLADKISYFFRNGKEQFYFNPTLAMSKQALMRMIFTKNTFRGA